MLIDFKITLFYGMSPVFYLFYYDFTLMTFLGRVPHQIPKYCLKFLNYCQFLWISRDKTYP